MLLAESPDELQKMLDMMGQYAEEWKFSFNASKSKTMVVGATSGSERWRISGKEMEEEKAFKYLGVWFDRSMCFYNRFNQDQMHSDLVSCQTRSSLSSHCMEPQG